MKALALYVARRILWAIPTLLLVAVMVFVLVRLIPGDPAQVALGDNASEAQLEALRIAMGLHAGPAIIGEIGYGQATSLTAVGDTINTASRLEGLAKEHDVQLAVSAELVNRAGLVNEGHERLDISLRGRQATLETWIVADAARISAALQPTPSNA